MPLRNVSLPQYILLTEPSLLKVIEDHIGIPLNNAEVYIYTENASIIVCMENENLTIPLEEIAKYIPPLNINL